jgi:hypothetical protein
MPQTEQLRENIASITLGKTRKTCGCIMCGNTKVSPSDFNDDCSRREFDISRMCQNCQDDFFTEEGFGA